MVGIVLVDVNAKALQYGYNYVDYATYGHYYASEPAVTSNGHQRLPQGLRWLRRRKSEI